MRDAGQGRIELESRYSEIEPLMAILSEWMQDHEDDEKLKLRCIYFDEAHDQIRYIKRQDRKNNY